MTWWIPVCGALGAVLAARLLLGQARRRSWRPGRWTALLWRRGGSCLRCGSAFQRRTPRGWRGGIVKPWETPYRLVPEGDGVRRKLARPLCLRCRLELPLDRSPVERDGEPDTVLRWYSEAWVREPQPDPAEWHDILRQLRTGL